VVHVDGLSVFKGLDYVITNSKKKEGWTVGIQCKTYIGSALPKCKLEEYGTWSKSISAPSYIRKARSCMNDFRRKSLFLQLSMLSEQIREKGKDSAS